MRLTRILGLLALAVVATLLAYVAAWFATAFVIERQVEQWAQTRRDHGATINFGTPVFSGFPGQVIVAIPDVALALPPESGGWSWRTGTVHISASVLHFANLRADISGEHTLVAPAIPQPLHISTASAEVALRIDGSGRLVAANLTTDSAVVRFGDVTTLVLEMSSADVSFSSPDEAAVVSRLVIDATAIALPVTIPPLARAVDRLHLALDVQGPVGRGPLPKILEAWRSAGGAVDVREFSLDWPPLAVSGSGTVALDDRLQPLTAFALKFAGFTAAVDALEARGYVAAEVAGASRLILGLLAKTPPGGGVPELSLAFTVQDRKLQVGPVTLLEVPQLIWSADFVVP